MKNRIQNSLPLGMIQTSLILAFFLSIPFSLLSQEESIEKKVTVKIIKEVDGKKIVKDTTFIVTGDDDVKMIVKQFTADSEGDADVMVDVSVDVDTDSDADADAEKSVIIIKSGDKTDDFYFDSDESKKVFIYKDGDCEEHVMVRPHCGHSKMMILKSGDGEDEQVIIMRPHGKHKVVKWTGEEGEEFEFNYEVDMENFEKDMVELNAEMKELQIVMMDEEGHLNERIIELEHLSELEGLEDFWHFENMEVVIVPSSPHFAPRRHGDFTWHKKGRMAVTDEELRDAGIKNKPDRLELDEININNEDGVIDLSFSLSEEGTPKVAVYNIYGDKVFSGKPELMNNKYQVKMDLSKKQHGNYYLMIVSGNSSKTMRLKI